MTTDCECIVIGAGVVGLVIAVKLAQAGRDVLIVEQESTATAPVFLSSKISYNAMTGTDFGHRCSLTAHNYRCN